MTRTQTIVAAIGAALAVAPLFAAAQQKVDLGKREYDSNCAVCHGLSGKGDGPYAMDVGVKGVRDLTLLTKKNEGVFPLAGVYETIDGRKLVKAHGTRDMPIWGNEYLAKAPDPVWVVPYDPEVFVRARIVALVDYVHRLQAR